MNGDILKKLPKRQYEKGEIKPAGNAEWYGLTKDEWMAIFARQGYVCAICKRGDKKMVTDHFHVRGWKDMKPSERKKYVRGILCTYCNFKVLGKHPLYKLQNAVIYLEEYERRAPK